MTRNSKLVREYLKAAEQLKKVRGEAKEDWEQKNTAIIAKMDLLWQAMDADERKAAKVSKWPPRPLE
tara:strand:- start:140277 stop:140477 length:201 start_codon:yes stop_codon:yes gene_type:complete